MFRLFVLRILKQDLLQQVNQLHGDIIQVVCGSGIINNFSFLMYSCVKIRIALLDDLRAFRRPQYDHWSHATSP